MDEIRVVAHARNLPQETVAGLAASGVSAQYESEQLTLTVQSVDVLPDILRRLVSSGADVYSFTMERVSLEELFVNIMGEDRGL
jgi:hypothetical protein